MRGRKARRQSNRPLSFNSHVIRECDALLTRDVNQIALFQNVREATRHLLGYYLV